MDYTDWTANNVAPPALNVRQFGAVGDGTTDDTQAIQRAVDAAAEVHGQLYFPAGVYACSTIRLKPLITLTGCATWTYWYFEGSVIKLIDDKAACLFDATGAVGVVIDGLALDGLGAGGNQLGEGIHGVMVRNNPFPKFDQNGAFDDAIRIDRSLVRNFSGDGVHLDGICVFTVRHSMIANNLGNGIYVHGYDGYVLDCWLAANHKAGYGAYELNASVTMTANRIEWNQGGGIVLHGGNSYSITGNFIDRSGGPGVWLRPRGEEPCNRITVTGNLFRRSGAHWRNLGEDANSHVLLEGCRGVVCTGNTFSTGRDDFDQGEVTPAYGVVYGGLQNCIIKDNVLHEGAVQQLIVNRGRNDDAVSVKDNLGSLVKAVP
jgi:hypothetical protein